MNKLISRIIHDVTYKAQQMNATITVDKLEPCVGDPIQISQVFANLVDNSLKYAHPSRSPKIHISSTTQNGENIYCVEDNGIGIHPEYHAKIFEIFHRLDPQYTTAGEGLGLAIVRRILDRHNGKIWVESTPDEGSQFFISLSRKELS
jgi:signal transduction histidine kinase